MWGPCCVRGAVLETEDVRPVRAPPRGHAPGEETPVATVPHDGHYDDSWYGMLSPHLTPPESGRCAINFMEGAVAEQGMFPEREKGKETYLRR